MKYPISGAFFSDIKCRALIYAKPDTVHSAQYFEIYRITTPINGVVTVYAHHISYMLASIPVPMFTSPQSAPNALKQIEAYSKALIPHGFSLAIDADSKIINSIATMENSIPRSVRSALVGDEGSFVDVFGGELEFDGFTVTVKDRIGKSTDSRIVYGFNMTAFKQDENMTSVYTGIYPFATTTIADDSGNYINNIVTLPTHIIFASDAPEFKKVKVVDLTSKFTDSNGITAEITPENLQEAALEYIAENQWGVPSVNIKVSFVSLAQTEEYKNSVGIEDVSLGDTLEISYPNVGVNATARCVKTIYNVLSEMYDSIEVGKTKKSIVSTLAQMRRDIKKIRRQ